MNKGVPHRIPTVIGPPFMHTEILVTMTDKQVYVRTVQYRTAPGVLVLDTVFDAIVLYLWSKCNVRHLPDWLVQTQSGKYKY